MSLSSALSQSNQAVTYSPNSFSSYFTFHLFLHFLLSLFFSLSPQMKEKMGYTTVSVHSTTVFFTTFLILLSSVHSFYLPGVAPRDFQTVCFPFLLSIFLHLSISTPCPYILYLSLLPLLGSRVLALICVESFSLFI